MNLVIVPCVGVFVWLVFNVKMAVIAVSCSIRSYWIWRLLKMGKETFYVILNRENGEYLSSLTLSLSRGADAFTWCSSLMCACRFECTDEVAATISFIGYVIDWELEEQLVGIPVTLSIPWNV